MESPCINICQLDDAGICSGCLRSLDEIVAWSSLTDAGRRAIMNDLPERRRRVEKSDNI